MLTQQQIVFDRNAEMARRGDEIVVLVDGPDADAEGDTTVVVGRTSRQAPEIDGIVRVVTGEAACPGELLRCRVAEADGYDLVAHPVTDQSDDGRVALPVVE